MKAKYRYKIDQFMPNGRWYLWRVTDNNTSTCIYESAILLNMQSKIDEDIEKES